MSTLRKKDIEDFLDDEEEFDEEVMEDEEYDDEEDDEDDEEYEYDYEEGHSRVIPYAVMAAALVAFVSLGYYAYNSSKESFEGEELMLVEAEQTPIKERPVEPGGLQFPYQDKSVFETITKDSSGNEKIEVVSSVEEPLPIEQKAVEPTVETAAPTEVVATTEPVVQEPVKVAEVPKPVIESKPLVKEEAPKPTAPFSPPKSATTATTTGSGTVQLGAYKSDADARAAWSKISGTHSVLSGLSPSIVRADLGEKGVFYRLRVPGVNADSTCASLKTAGQACMKVN